MKNFKNNGTIYSDDPNALQKLKSKLEELEAQRDKIKKENKAARKAGQPPHPAFMLQNLNQNIRRYRERISSLAAEKIIRTEDGNRQSYDDIGLTYLENYSINRVQLLFEEKPSEEVRKKLKMWGFRYAPSEEAWQRQLNSNGRYSAKQVIECLKNKKSA